MHSSVSVKPASRTFGKPQGRYAQLEQAIEHAAELLPAQGPITVFVHHNTLHAFEDRPFDEAVLEGSRIFGCHPYLPEDRYRQELERGRIREPDLAAVLVDELGERADGLIGFLGTRYYLRLSMLRYPFQVAPAPQLRWLMAESDALRRFRAEAHSALKLRVIEETRHWVMRNLEVGSEQARNGRAGSVSSPSGQGTTNSRPIHELIEKLLPRFERSPVENWTSATWESFYLHLLWQVCRHGARSVPRFESCPDRPLRHRDLLMAATGQDSDDLVHDVLIRFCSAFLDQGISGWRLPGRDSGFYRAFVEFYRGGGRAPEPWRRGLPKELARLRKRGAGPLESLAESLDLLGVGADEQKAFITQTLLALRGWGGMIWQLETRGDRAARPVPHGSLTEMLCVRLILERHALAHLADKTLDFRGPLSELRSVLRRDTVVCDENHEKQRAFLVFQLAQVLGWKPQDLLRLTSDQWTALVREVEEFSPLERRRIYHLAFERRHRQETLDAIAAHARLAESDQAKADMHVSSRPLSAEPMVRSSPPNRADGQQHRAPVLRTPAAQVVCCLDEREESFRRHLEELAPEVETYGVAGFFYVAMYYRGVGDAHYIPLCPVNIQPRHYVLEYVPYTLTDWHRRRSRLRRAIGTAVHRLHHGSRTVGLGALTSLAGSVAAVPLVARVLFPRLTSQILRSCGRFVQPPPTTRLQLERTSEEPGPDEGQIGFSVDEMAAVVERLLRDTGLTSGFSRMVVVMGHGSSSLNNPHESAHDCGACGGGRGGPNARAFAMMANDPRVREILARRELFIPRDTVFVGAYHNTCDERVLYYDLERLPPSHAARFDSLSQWVDEARRRNAHERCRRFESAPLSLSSAAALRHVEGRAEDLAQVRPEYGHATNAVCIVGRRDRTRGLFLDRRSFLVSYDSTQDDPQQSILARILQAVVPVCAGINLEYYFSFSDPTGWGCGTKLPHNVTGLLGVMDGAASDLRPGLPWQMVEIHEPVRLLFVVEATPDALRQVLEQNPSIARLCLGGWVQLAALDPESSKIHLLRAGDFQPYKVQDAELPEAESSVAWYRGWRDHLGYARIRTEPGRRRKWERTAP